MTATDDELPVRARAVGDAVAAAFASVTEGVTAVRESSGSVAELVSTLLGAVAAAEESDALDHVAQAVDFDRAAAEAVALGQSLTAPALTEACEALDRRLDEAARATKELGVIAMMTKISLANSSWAQAEAETYTSSLESLIGRLTDVVATAREQARPIYAERREAAKEIAVTAEALTRVKARIGQSANAADSLVAERDARLDGLRREADRLGADIAGEIGRLVPCLQFADELAQRIDHVGRILRGDGAPGAADRAAAPAIAAAQLAALAEDCAAIHAEADRAVSAIAETARDGRDALARDDLGPVALWLDANRAVVAAVHESTDRALDHLHRAQTKLKRVVVAAESASEAIDRFRTLVADLDLAACNAAVASAHASQRGGVLNYLAGCVADGSKTCAASLQGCAAALEQIRESLAAGRDSALESRLVSFAQTRDGAASAIAAQQESLRRQAEVSASLEETLDTLADAADRTHAEIRRSSAEGGALATLAGAGAARISPETARWAEALYTTEAERRVHERLTGEPVAGGPAADAASPGADAAADEDDLEGFLL
jgi:chromosome segregation ATPase